MSSKWKPPSELKGTFRERFDTQETRDEYFKIMRRGASAEITDDELRDEIDVLIEKCCQIWEKKY